MSENCSLHKGRWVMIITSKFTCMGKIEDYNEDIIILSQAKFNVDKLITTYVGIDYHLIENVEFIASSIDRSSNLSKIEQNVTSQVLNVFTSETKPPSIKRGGSSSAVNRNLTRNEKMPKLNNASFSDFGSRSRKSSIGNKNQEPSWFNYSPEEMAVDFDFDKHLALFDKDKLTENGNKSTNDGSDSNESVGLKMNFKIKKLRSSTFSFDSEDFTSYENHWQPFSKPTATGNYCESISDKRDIFNALQEIGVIPSVSNNRNDKKLSQIPMKYSQQPDLVREITQQLNNDLLGYYKPYPVISVKKITTDFSKFTEYWNLDSNYIFPVFTIKQRDVLFENASQLGYGSDIIDEIVGQSLSEFVLKQVGDYRIKSSVKIQIPKIAILLSKCNASVYALSVARFLLRNNCNLVVFIDDNKTTNINYKVDAEISRLKKLIFEFSTAQGYSIITHKIKDLANKTFDFIITGVESDSCDNQPSSSLKTWCLNQTCQILCINPPSSSSLMWKSAVFIGVPTFSHSNLNIKIDNNINVVCSNSNRKVNLENTIKKPDGLILLCNINFPENVFSFLGLNYRSCFTGSKWLRLYSDNDLCLVE